MKEHFNAAESMSYLSREENANTCKRNHAGPQIMFLIISWSIFGLIYDTIQKFGVVFFYVCERSLFCSSRLHLFDQKYCKNLKYYYNLNQLISV